MKDLSVERVLEGLSTKTIGRSLESYDVVDSTNSMVKRRAQEGEEEGLVIVAKKQLQGRGRKGREWCSQEGGLYLSLLLRPSLVIDGIQQLNILVAIVLSQLLRKEYSLPVTIKWPNDIEYCGRKLAGILTQVARDKEQCLFLVMGLGLNVNQMKEDWPDPIKGQVTTLREELKEEIDLTILVISFLNRFEEEYRKFQLRGQSIVEDPRLVDLISTLGEDVRIETLGGRFKGRAVRLTKEGSLVVELKDGICREFFEGDVTIVRRIEEIEGGSNG